MALEKLNQRNHTMMLTLPMSYQCTVCGKCGEGVFRCSRCKLSTYCGMECQRTDWSRHKKHCISKVHDVEYFQKNIATNQKVWDGLVRMVGTVWDKKKILDNGVYVKVSFQNKKCELECALSNERWPQDIHRQSEGDFVSFLVIIDKALIAISVPNVNQRVPNVKGFQPKFTLTCSQNSSGKFNIGFVKYGTTLIELF